MKEEIWEYMREDGELNAFLYGKKATYCNKKGQLKDRLVAPKTVDRVLEKMESRLLDLIARGEELESDYSRLL